MTFQAAVEVMPSPGIQQKGETIMLVKARWNVKDANGWHKPGEVFETSETLGECVEILSSGKTNRSAPKEEPVVESVAEEVPGNEPEEKTEEPVRQRNSGRRKNGK